MLVVVLYHVGIGPVRAGYLGVDVFFVISGFLITTLIATGIEHGHFTLAGFYFRRAKRLLPAAYVTILLTLVAAQWTLDGPELRDLSTQIVGAVTFTANIVLWQQAGYFETAADLKPLLHTWSLSLEEQYYLLVPAAMLLTPRRLWLPLAVGGLVASLALCLVGTQVKPVATFYLLPTRAWELLAGSVGALLVLRQRAEHPVSEWRAVRALFYPSVLALLLLPLIPLGSTHPGVGAILACVATLAVILRHHPGLEQALPTRLLAFVGDFSYSLYLVHWPVLALLRNAWGNPSAELPLNLRLGALALSVLLAYALYRLVERPIHRARLQFSPRVAAATALASLLLMLSPPLIVAAGGSPAPDATRQANHGFSKACDLDGQYTPDPACRSRAGAKVLVWGDSFAMHLIPGLDADVEAGGVIQATMNTCGPFLGLAPVQLAADGEPSLYDRAWARRCIAFNDSVLDFVRRNPDVEIVVLSSLLTAYTDASGWKRLERDQGDSLQPLLASRAHGALLDTAAALRAAGKKVVMVAPPPLANFDVGICLERRKAGRIALGVDSSCLIGADDYRRRRHEVLALLDKVHAQGLPVISFDALLCEGAVCRTSLNEVGLYRDFGHFSNDGSRLLARELRLGRLIAETAR